MSHPDPPNSPPPTPRTGAGDNVGATSEEMNTALAAAFAMNLSHWEDNLKLVALNNALAFNGPVPELNPAFEDAVAHHFIQDTGLPYDAEALKAALSLEINRRVDAGTFP